MATDAFETIGGMRRERDDLADRLAKLAQAATPGPWTYNGRNRIATPPIDVDEADWGPEGHEGLRIHTAQDPHAYRYADAEFIAAASPTAILHLIDQVRLHGLCISLVEDHRDRLLNRFAAVEALADKWERQSQLAESAADARAGLSDEVALRQYAEVMSNRSADLRAVLDKTAPTGTTKENQ